MSDERPETRKGKSKRQKLTLGKETLKDLSANKATVKGGQPTGLSCYDGMCSF